MLRARGLRGAAAAEAVRHPPGERHAQRRARAREPPPRPGQLPTGRNEGHLSTYVQRENQERILDPQIQENAMDELNIALRAVEANYQQTIRPSFLCDFLMMAGMQFSQRDRSRC